MTIEEFVEARGGELLRYAYLITGDVELAKDVTQTALTKAFRQWARISRTTRPEAYLRRMITNAYIDGRRLRQSKDLLVADAPETSTYGGPGDTIDDRDQLRRALRVLTPRARTVVVLRYYVHLSDDEIAEALDMSNGTVRTTAAKALDKLRTELDIAHS